MKSINLSFYLWGYSPIVSPKNYHRFTQPLLTGLLSPLRKNTK